MSKMLPKSEETQRVAFSLYPSEVQDIREHAARWGTVSRALEIAVEVLWAWEDLWDRGLLRVDPKTFLPLEHLGLGVPEELVMKGKARPELKVPFACRVSNRTVRMIDALAKEDRYG